MIWCSLIFSCYSSFAQRYWVSATSSNWNNPSNWSATSGGIGGASVPAASDFVYFNLGSNNCILDVAPTIAGISINGYSGVIDLNGNNLIVSGASALTFTTGTILNSSGAFSVTITSSASATFNGTVFNVDITGTAAQLNFNGGSIFNGSVDLKAANVLLNGTGTVFNTFNNTTTLEKTGSGNDLGTGGNRFNGATTLKNSGSGTFESANSFPDIFNGDLILSNTGTAGIPMADQCAGNQFNGNIIVNSTGNDISFCNGSVSASATLAEGKTISAGTFSGGRLLLKRFTQGTVVGGTTQNLTLTGTASVDLGPSSVFNGPVNFISPQMYLQGSTYNSTAYLEKSGVTNNLGSGGNTFNGLTTLKNSGNAFFASAYNSPDIFNADLILNNTGSGWIALSDNSAGNMYNGNITVSSSNGAASAGITFGNGPGTTMTSFLANGKTLNVGTGFSAGRLLLRGFHQVGTTAQNLTFTGTALLYLGPYASFDGDVNFKAPQVYLNGCTYNGTTYLEKTGGTNNPGNGGNTFNGTTTLRNTGSGFFVTNNTTADVFNGDLTLTNNGSSSVGVADKTAGNLFNGNIVVNSTGGVGITFAYNTAATAIFAEGKTITASTFTGGTLYLRRFTQGTTAGGTPQTITLSGTAVIELGPSSIFNGSVNFTAPQVYLNGCTFNSVADITKNGATTNNCNGGNIFNGTTSLTNNSSAQWLLANSLGDTYNGSVSFSKLSTGAFLPAYNQTNYFHSDITINSASTVILGSGTGVVQLEGASNQIISAVTAVPVIQRLTMNKTSGSNTVTLDSPVDIGVTAILTNGVVQTSTGKHLNFTAASSVSGASNSSYVDGPVRKTGNTLFTFPVGDNAVYRPLTISAPALATDQFTAQYFMQNQTYGGPSTYDPSLATLSTCEYWNLDRTTGASNVSATLSWNSPDCGGPYITNPASLRVSAWDGSMWTNQGNGGTTGSSTTGTITSGSVLTSYGPLTLSSILPENPLPLEFIFFDYSIEQSGAIKLLWITAEEINTDYFEVERSTDGRIFLAIGTVKSSGKKSGHYSYEDLLPAKELSYYRIKQLDQDGRFTYSSVIVVNNRKKEVRVYPNPAVDKLMIENYSGQKYTIRIMNNMGEEVFMVAYETSVNEIDVSRFNKGVYLLEIQELENRGVHTIVINH